MPFAKLCAYCGKRFLARERKVKYCPGSDHYYRDMESLADKRRSKLLASNRVAIAKDLNAAIKKIPKEPKILDLPKYKSFKLPHRTSDRAPDWLGKRILVIPDTQVKPGVPTKHLRWIGQYIAEKRPDVIVMIGDWWDMPSLSEYDRGKKSFEGRRYIEDVRAGNEAMALMTSQYRPAYRPEEHFFIGNHEDRITRASESQAEFTGLLGLHQLNLEGWIVHQKEEVFAIEGVKFAHYFTSGPKCIPVGSAAVLLKIAQGSAVQGHVQKVDMAVHEKSGAIALMCGICYLHDEVYLGPQGNNCRRQVVMLNEVKNGLFDPMFVSLNFLSRRYGKS